MSEWLEVAKIVVPAIVTGVGGWWGHRVWVRRQLIEAELRERDRLADFDKKRRDAELLQQQRDAEYDEFKRKRRLVGAGEVERMERADRLTDLLIKQKSHQITREEFNAFKDELITGRKPRKPTTDTSQPYVLTESITVTKGATLTIGEGVRVGGHAHGEGQGTVTSDDESGEKLNPERFMELATFDGRLTVEQRRLIAVHVLAVLKQKGPNDHPVGFMENGDKVEWLPSEPEDIENGDEPYWPMPLLRNEAEIHEAAKEFFDKVWWNRHQIWLERIASGEEPLTEEEEPLLEMAKKEAKEVEDKYGAENLGWDDFEWGMVNGKLSALRWVGGSEWDFLDT